MQLATTNSKEASEKLDKKLDEHIKEMHKLALSATVGIVLILCSAVGGLILMLVQRA